jgi:3-oxoacyl-[acyl-carrier protein] reductase
MGGLGEAICIKLAALGYKVVTTCSPGNCKMDEWLATMKEAGYSFHGYPCDVADYESALACVAKVEKEVGAIDVLVNNAGATKRGDFFALGDADWQDGFGLKFFAHVRLARAAWPLLKERRGSLITIGGTSGRKPHASFAIGSSVNAACAAFSKALADMGKQDGVQVNCIHPSLVDTDRQGRRIAAEMKRSGLPEAVIRAQFCAEAGITRFGTPADVAALTCFIVSKNGSWLHGATIDLDGGEIPVL